MAHHRTSGVDYFPLWAQAHVRGEQEPSPALIAWMRSRAPEVRVLMLHFPPYCVVRLPGAFEVGAVAGYHPTGSLWLCRGLDMPREQWWWVHADDAEFVAAWRGLTQERVREILMR